MRGFHFELPFVLAGLGVLVAFSGCVTAPKFAPPEYTVDASRPYQVLSKRTVTVCPAFDRLTGEEHNGLAPTFNPSAYLTDVMEKELSAAGIAHDRVGFAYDPSFDGIQKALKSGALKHPGAVVLAGAINHFPSDRVISCDFKLYSEQGDLLFEKRCLCMNFTTSEAWLFVPHMAMQQLFADPDFQRVIQ